MPSRIVVMGRVLAPYGVQGWVKIDPFTADPEALLGHRTWWLRRTGGDWREARVIGARRHSSTLVAGLAEVATRDDALELKGAEIGVERSALPAAGPDEAYWEDLVGLAVVNREGVALGRVTDIVTHGAHPVLIVRAEADVAGVVQAGQERLIPYVPAVVEAVDQEQGRIEVDWGADY